MSAEGGDTFILNAVVRMHYQETSPFQTLYMKSEVKRNTFQLLEIEDVEKNAYQGPSCSLGG